MLPNSVGKKRKINSVNSGEVNIDPVGGIKHLMLAAAEIKDKKPEEQKATQEDQETLEEIFTLLMSLPEPPHVKALMDSDHMGLKALAGSLYTKHNFFPQDLKNWIGRRVLDNAIPNSAKYAMIHSELKNMLNTAASLEKENLKSAKKALDKHWVRNIMRVYINAGYPLAHLGQEILNMKKFSYFIVDQKPKDVSQDKCMPLALKMLGFRTKQIFTMAELTDFIKSPKFSYAQSADKTSLQLEQEINLWKVSESLVLLSNTNFISLPRPVSNYSPTSTQVPTAEQRFNKLN